MSDPPPCEPPNETDLLEYVGQTLTDAMWQLCIEQGQIERIIEEFDERLDISRWFPDDGE